MLSGEDEMLLVGGDSFLVLDLGLDIVDVSEDLTSRVIIFLVRVLTKICMLGCRGEVV